MARANLRSDYSQGARQTICAAQPGADAGARPPALRRRRQGSQACRSAGVVKTLLDGRFQALEGVEELPPFLMFRLWLAAGYLYEHRDETLIPDHVFDRLSLL